jgi:hypothetical protein
MVNSMRYFVQSTDTGCYLTATGKWTLDQDQAYPFSNWREAHQFCRVHDIRNGEYVVELDKLGGELRMECC